MKPKDVKALRKELDLTQVEFASLIGVAPNTVARWEQGVMRLHPMTVRVVKQVVDAERAKRAPRRQ